VVINLEAVKIQHIYVSLPSQPGLGRLILPRLCVSLVVPLQTLGFPYSTEVDERNFQHKFPVSLLIYLMQPHGV
jgi:hypothetical protein